LELVTRLVDFLDESASWSAREHCASLLVYVFFVFSVKVVRWLCGYEPVREGRKE
jgi:quinol-cytochrome oxidoreductase complex cytochrome b subunit